MSSVPKSQYDDLQKRHENMRKNREREQRRATKLEQQLAEREKLLLMAKDAMSKAANEIRVCDYTPARSTLLATLAAIDKELK
jgi:hypothetical protein